MGGEEEMPEQVYVPHEMMTRLEKIEEELIKNSQTHGRIFEKIEKLNVDLAIASTQYTHIIALLSDLKNDVIGLKEIPAGRWNDVVKTIISGLVGAGIAWLLLGKV